MPDSKGLSAKKNAPSVRGVWCT